MYEIIKYVSSHNMDIDIRYLKDEDIIKIRVSRKDSASVYAVELLKYGIECLNVNPESLLLDEIKTMVMKMEGEESCIK